MLSEKEGIRLGKAYFSCKQDEVFYRSVFISYINALEKFLLVERQWQLGQSEDGADRINFKRILRNEYGYTHRYNGFKKAVEYLNFCFESAKILEEHLLEELLRVIVESNDKDSLDDYLYLFDGKKEHDFFSEESKRTVRAVLGYNQELCDDNEAAARRQSYVRHLAEYDNDRISLMEMENEFSIEDSVVEFL